MRNIVFLFSFFIMFTACKGSGETKANDQQEPQLKRYDIKSGMIEYQTTISGNVLGSIIKGEGTEALYFDNWGALEVKKEKSSQTTEANIMGHKSTETTNTHTLDKLDNGKSYHVDYDTQKIYQRTDPMMELFKQSKTDVGDAGKKMLESMGGKKIGSESIMGYDCEIWDLMGVKQWIHKGVMLRAESNLMGVKTLTEPISIKLNKKVDKDKFDLPDFEIVKEEGYMEDKDFQMDMEESRENIQKMQKMSFKEWKKEVQKNDAEMRDMSDEELKDIYDKMQAALELMGG